MTDFLDNFLDDYFAECEEHLTIVRRGLLALEGSVGHDRPDPVVTEELFRSFHSLKGISGMVEHRESDLAFRESVGFGDPQIDQQSVPVVHQRMLGVREPGWLSVALLRQLRFGIRGRLVRLVASLLAVEIHRRIAWIVRRSLLGTLRLETLLRGPRIDQRSIDVKCSPDSRRAARACVTTLAKNWRATSCSISRARFSENVLWSNDSSIMLMFRNQRNNRL